MTKGSGDARMQPLYFLITTAGTDTHSICYETHQKAKDILEGREKRLGRPAIWNCYQRNYRLRSLEKAQSQLGGKYR